jgi:glutamate dehydrogenase (NADP+)
MELKNLRRGRIREYADRFHGATFTPAKDEGSNPLWAIAADCAFPSATQNEISGVDARNLVANGVKLVAEGANMPTTPEGVDRFLEAKVLYGPGKAANAGGVAVSGLEMTQDIEHLSWTREQVDAKLRQIMRAIHTNVRAAAEEYGRPGDYVLGANIAGFVKVADAMVDESTV